MFTKCMYNFPIILLYNTLMLQCLPLHSYDYTCCMMYTFFPIITYFNTSVSIITCLFYTCCMIISFSYADT